MHDLGDFDESNDMDRIETLKEGSKETMMNMIYNAVINGEDKAIAANTPPNEKIQALNNILDFFIGIEEYEKCSNIKKIIDKIQC